jgi:hypothetical protein
VGLRKYLLPDSQTDRLLDPAHGANWPAAAESIYVATGETHGG